jgi:hypothetical protein
MVKLVGNIINVYILLKLWFGWRNKTPLLEALSTNSTVPEDIARSFRNHAGASNIVTSYKTNNTPPTVQLVCSPGFYCHYSSAQIYVNSDMLN